MLDADSALVTGDGVADLLNQAITALRNDELEPAALLLQAAETFLHNLVDTGGDAEPPGAARLRDLWREAADAADAADQRLRTRGQQLATSQRAARAYG